MKFWGGTLERTLYLPNCWYEFLMRYRLEVDSEQICIIIRAITDWMILVSLFTELNAWRTDQRGSGLREMPMLSVSILRNVSENSFPLHQCTLLSCTGTYCTDYTFSLFVRHLFRHCLQTTKFAARNPHYGWHLTASAARRPDGS